MNLRFAIVLFLALPSLAVAEPFTNDPTRPHTWLPAEAQTGIRLLGCSYNGSQLAASRPFTNGMLQTTGSRWTCEVRGTSPEMEVTFKLVDGTAKSAGVAVAFDFANWSTNNYVLAPAALYNGNRYRSLGYRYPPYIYNPQQRPLDMPVTITDVPRLNLDGRPAKIEMLTSNCSTPLLGFFDPKAKRGWILLTLPGTRFGNSGLFVQENAAKMQASFVVSAPGVREWRYVMCGRAASGDHAANWQPGDEVTLKLRVYVFPADDLPAFFAKVFDVRKALTGPTEYRNIAPYSYIADTILKHFDTHKWFADPKYPSVSSHPGSDSQYAYQIGWGGPPVYSHPWVIAETPERLRRASLTLDTLMKAQAKSGLFYAMFKNGQPIGDTFNECFHRRTITMVRRTGEGLRFGLLQLELFRARGRPVKPEWESMFRTAADGLVKLFNNYGQFGQFVDADTGQMEINGSTAGGVCVTGLALASQYFHESRYLAVAEKAGQLYYNRDLRHGYAGGGPAEILQCPDSESAYNLAEAYIVLYELTGKREWLNCACDATHLFATWMVSYDYTFPPGSDLGRVGVRSTGSIWASVQNEASTPGLYISSGDFLLKLYRATGDRRYAELYKDTAHNIIQYVNTPTNPINPGGVAGAVSERVNLSDWEGKGNIGMISHGDSNMAWETLAALTCLENPGIYLRTDTGELLVLDHVEASIVKRDAGNVTLQIINPTKYPATVTIFAESTPQAVQPLGFNAFLHWPKVELKPGGTATVLVTSRGELKTL